VIPNYITTEVLDRIVQDAIREDVGDGDHSTLAVIPEDKSGKALLLAKEKGIAAGLVLADFIYEKFNKDLRVDFYKEDGTPVKKGDIIYEVRGNARDILSSERLVLNFIQRMCGIATHTRKLVELIGDLPVRLLDTRKTTPNFRLIEKWAVLIGGGSNHRIGLFDMIMLKDNHIDLAGGIKKAIIQTADYLKRTGRNMRIEIETRNLEEVREVLDVGMVDIIMLDNMNIDDMKAAVKIIDGKFATEASGNVSERTIRKIAECGVDYISVGSLTHSVKSLDLSLQTKLVN
jgi:nicotinate-nucleotide pyrophosphorylase (carboxylating)